MLKKILVGVAALVGLLLIIIATRPATYHVERSTTVAAPAATISAQVADFHGWAAWSPWAHLDPAMKTTYVGSGVGATYSWEGNDKVGEGKMTLTKLEPGTIGIKLEFIKPFAGLNDVAFNLAAVAEGTKVTWNMDGNNNFMGKAFSLVMDMDKMIGGDFERGLASLKTVSEARAKADAEARAKAEAEAKAKADAEAAEKAKAEAEAAAAEAAKSKGKKHK
jgi:hypothetical protein